MTRYNMRKKNLKLEAIENRVAKLNEAAERFRKRDKGPAIEAIVAMMLEHRVTLRDLRRSDKLPGFNPRKPPLPKYQDPETGKTWSGRGIPPSWIREAETAGKSRDDFLIK